MQVLSSPLLGTILSFGSDLDLHSTMQVNQTWRRCLYEADTLIWQSRARRHNITTPPWLEGYRNRQRLALGLTRNLRDFTFTRVDRSLYDCVIGRVGPDVIDSIDALLLSLNPTFVSLKQQGKTYTTENGVVIASHEREPWKLIEPREVKDRERYYWESEDEHEQRKKWHRVMRREPPGTRWVNNLREMLSPCGYTLGCISNNQYSNDSSEELYLEEVERFVGMVKQLLISPVQIYFGAHAKPVESLDRDECLALVDSVGRIVLFHAHYRRFYG